MLPIPNTTLRTVKSASNPVYANADHTQIRLNVVFNEIEILGVIPFVACESDPENHGRVIFARAQSGEFGAVGAYVEPEDALN
jgi:hypothetical protein